MADLETLARQGLEEGWIEIQRGLVDVEGWCIMHLRRRRHDSLQAKVSQMGTGSIMMIEASKLAPPDLTHPATCGVLLEKLRERWSGAVELTVYEDGVANVRLKDVRGSLPDIASPPIDIAGVCQGEALALALREVGRG